MVSHSTAATRSTQAPWHGRASAPHFFKPSRRLAHAARSPSCCIGPTGQLITATANMHRHARTNAAAGEDKAGVANTLPQAQHRLHNVALVVWNHLHTHQIHAPAVQQLQGRGRRSRSGRACCGEPARPIWAACPVHAAPVHPAALMPLRMQASWMPQRTLASHGVLASLIEPVSTCSKVIAALVGCPQTASMQCQRTSWTWVASLHSASSNPQQCKRLCRPTCLIANHHQSCLWCCLPSCCGRCKAAHLLPPVLLQMGLGCCRRCMHEALPSCRRRCRHRRHGLQTCAASQCALSQPSSRLHKHAGGCSGQQRTWGRQAKAGPTR